MNPLERIMMIIKTYPEGDSDLKAQIVDQALDMLKNGINFYKLNNFLEACHTLMDTVPLASYQLYCPLVDSMNTLLLDALSHALKDQQFPRKSFLQYFFMVMNDYNSVSESLAVLGLIGEAWNYHILAMNPLHRQGQLRLDWPEGLWVEACELQVPQAREVIVSIMANFFYISRILGHNRQECINSYRDTRRWLKLGEEATEVDIYYLCYITDHLRVEPESPLTKEVYAQLKQQFDVEMSLGRTNHALLIAETLSSMASFMGESEANWARKGLEIQPEHKISVQTKVKFALKICKESTPINVEGIMASITEFLQYVDGIASNQLIKNLQKQRLSDLVISCIVTFIQHGLYQAAMEAWLLWRYYPVKKDIYLNGVTYVGAIQNLYENKMVYLLYDGTTARYYEFLRDVDLVEIVKAKSRYENTWAVVVGQSNLSEAFVGDGVPDPRESDNYEGKLTRFYAPQQIAQILNQQPDQQKIVLLELSWMNAPLISLIQQYTNRSLAYSNHAQLKPPSEIKKVLIWCDPDANNVLYDAHNEKDALVSILNKSGLSYDIFIGADCTFQKFIECYTQGDYDVIWLMCHGKYNSDNPLQSELSISTESPVTLEYLFDHPFESEKRRLLVLNACESGASSVRYDSMAFVGLGASLSTTNQSVIGHLWSVDSFAAAVFGCLLMERLTEGEAWDVSVNDVQRIMKAGREEIIKSLTRVLDSDNQIMRSVSNRTSMEWNKLVYWASANLYE